MDKLRKNMWLLVSVGAILLFILTVCAYMKGSVLPYPGPWPLILVSGVVIAALGTALAFSGINLWKYPFHWQALCTILLDVITIIPISYAFIIWVIFTVA